MVYYLIMCRSLTYAQKVARTLERAGVTATVMRTPKGISKEGCSYCVKISERRFAQAMRALKESETPFTRVYKQAQSGEIREVMV